MVLVLYLIGRDDGASFINLNLLLFRSIAPCVNARDICSVTEDLVDNFKKLALEMFEFKCDSYKSQFFSYLIFDA